MDSEFTTILTIILEALNQQNQLVFIANILIKSFCILLLACVFILLFHKASASVKHLIWCTAFISIFLLPVFQVFIPGKDLPVPIVSEVMVTAFDEPEAVAYRNTITTIATSMGTSIIIIFNVVMLLLLAQIVMGLLRIYHIGKTSIAIDNNNIRKVLDTIIHQEGIVSSIRLLCHPQIHSPISWGIFKPAIALPVEASGWTSERLQHVLRHEVSHIQRLDWVSQIISRVVAAYCWLNPLVWFAKKRLLLEAENACDNTVVLMSNRHTDYAEDLLTIASNGKHIEKSSHVALAIAESFLGKRILSILNPNLKRHSTDSIWVLRSFLLALLLVTGMSSFKVIAEISYLDTPFEISTSLQVTYIPGNKIAIIRDGHIPEVRKPERSDFLESTDYQRIARLNETDIKAWPALSVANKALDTSIDVPDLSQVDFSAMQTENYEPSLLIPLSSTVPDYPARARQMHLEGYVVVEFDIGLAGEILNPKVIEAKPERVFDRSSLKAIKTYQYPIQYVNGEVVKLSGVRTRFVYRLNNENLD